MRGLVLHSQLVLDGGELHLEDCSFVNSSAEEGGALREQLAAATAESKAAEETVANYRRGMVDLLDV